MNEDATEKKSSPEPETTLATFASGCFWCTEAVFERVEGVESVVSGYCGGRAEDASYKQVSSGRTGHAEAVQIRFDPRVVSYEHLLALFWKSHDPTTLNRQGADQGTQYRSAIFYHDEEQRKAAEASKSALEAAGTFPRPIVTEIAEAGEFYEAEEYHQDYFRRNPDAPYCTYRIAPKLKKLGMSP